MAPTSDCSAKQRLIIALIGETKRRDTVERPGANALEAAAAPYHSLAGAQSAHVRVGRAVAKMPAMRKVIGNIGFIEFADAGRPDDVEQMRRDDQFVVIWCIEQGFESQFIVSEDSGRSRGVDDNRGERSFDTPGEIFAETAIGARQYPGYAEGSRSRRGVGAPDIATPEQVETLGGVDAIFLPPSNRSRRKNRSMRVTSSPTRYNIERNAASRTPRVRRTRPRRAPGKETDARR